MNAKAETQSITMEFDLPHPPAKVWRALTEPELLAKWLMSTDMKLAVGQSFTFKMQPTQGAPGPRADAMNRNVTQVASR